MIKPLILLSLFLGIIVAQAIPAHSSDSKQVDDASDADSSDEVENSDEDESADESGEQDAPALACLLFDNLGCNAECMTIASAFAVKGTGECIDESVCYCTLERDDSRGGPQIKKQIKEVNPAIRNLLGITKKAPASTRNLVERNESLNLKNIQKYVAEKLKPILKSSANQLKYIDYESSLKESLDGMTDRDLQSIVNQVRRTKNKKLNGIIDANLRSKQIKETPSEKKDTLAEAMYYLIIETFANEIDKKKLAAKKRARKPSPAEVKGKKKTIDEEPSKETKDSKPSTSNDGKTTKENCKNEIVSYNRFILPGFDKDFMKKYNGDIEKIFKGKGYRLLYKKSTGESLHIVWEKNSDMVDITISSEGSVSQNWRLDNANIVLNRNTSGSLSEVWDFGKTVYSYTLTPGRAGGQISSQWSNGEEDMKTLQKYQTLIGEWCIENEYLLKNQLDCVIYHT